MILSTIRMVIPAKKHNEVIKILRSIALKTRDESGCLGCCIYRDVEDNNVFMFQQHWKSEESLNLHVCSVYYLNILLILEMSIKQPEVRFETISDSTGIETIEKMRSTILQTEVNYPDGHRKVRTK